MPPLDDTASYQDMGPSLLASQPPSISSQPKPEAEWGTIYQHLESRMGFLRAWRWSWWVHWSQLAEFFLPRRWSWLVVANRMWKGRPVNDQIIDSMPLQAVRICAAGLWTGLTSPSRPWFKLDIALPWIKPDAESKEWLEDTERKVYTVLAQSNFYSSMAQAFQDVVVFGTSPVIIYEDSEDVIRCYVPCAGEYYLAAGARLSVDTLYREFVLTVAQIVEMFTLENCPVEVQKMWQQGGASLDSELVVAHAIEPNFDLDKRGRKRGTVKVVPDAFTFREVYWLRSNKADRPLSKRGFYGKPFMAARWAKVSNEPYSHSPCMDALGDTKQIQQQTRRKAEFIEKGVRPPMGANPELKNEPASIIPGMITYMNTDGGKKGFWPLFEPEAQWLQGMTNDIDKVSARIQTCLFVDIFMAISRMEGVQPRNQLELTKRDLERLQVLGPFIDLFEGEFAGPAIWRVIDILERRRMLKPRPASMKNVPMKINYRSIMRMAQAQSESVAMKDFLGTMGTLSTAAKAAGLPDPLRVVNLEESARHYADVTTYPQSCLFTKEQVEENDAARAQGEAQARLPGDMAAGVDAAKTLSETQIPGGNALDALLTGGTA